MKISRYGERYAQTTEQARSWTEREVAERWHRLFKGSLLSQRYCRDEVLTAAEDKALAKEIAHWRQRLMSISWFMRCLNEPIARAANMEDKVTGRFWEVRFNPQPCWMKKHLRPAWPTSSSIQFGRTWQ